MFSNVRTKELLIHSTEAHLMLAQYGKYNKTGPNSFKQKNDIPTYLALTNYVHIFDNNLNVYLQNIQKIVPPLYCSTRCILQNMKYVEPLVTQEEPLFIFRSTLVNSYFGLSNQLQRVAKTVQTLVKHNKQHFKYHGKCLFSWNADCKYLKHQSIISTVIIVHSWCS